MAENFGIGGFGSGLLLLMVQSGFYSPTPQSSMWGIVAITRGFYDCMICVFGCIAPKKHHAFMACVREPEKL